MGSRGGNNRADGGSSGGGGGKEIKSACGRSWTSFGCGFMFAYVRVCEVGSVQSYSAPVHVTGVS